MTKLISITCEDCHGRGFISRTELVRGKRVECGVHCQACNGIGATSFEFDCCDSCEEPTCCGECRPTPAPLPAPVIWNGGVVEAEGFDTASFAAAVKRARARAFYSITPLGNGAVRVSTGRTNATYQVSRHSCDCQAGQTYGRCQHRAACIWLHDCAGIDLCRHEVAGFDAQGNPVIATQLQEVA